MEPEACLLASYGIIDRETAAGCGGAMVGVVSGCAKKPATSFVNDTAAVTAIASTNTKIVIKATPAKTNSS